MLLMDLTSLQSVKNTAETGTKYYKNTHYGENLKIFLLKPRNFFNQVWDLDWDQLAGINNIPLVSVQVSYKKTTY